MVQEFKVAPWGREVKIWTPITYAISLLPAGILGIFGLVLGEPVLYILSLVCGLFGPGITSLAYLYAPQKYLLNDEKIVIKRPFSLHIPYKDIVGTEVVRKTPKGFRLIGSSGVFGHIGIFLIQDADGKYKTSKLYLTTCYHPLARIRTKKTIYYLSPAEPEIFVNALKSRLKEGKKVEL